MRGLKVGEKYRHFKGHIVEVKDVAKNTETLEDMVIYECSGNLWVRPMEMFLSEVDHEKYPDVTQRYRFEELGMYEYGNMSVPSRLC